MSPPSRDLANDLEPAMTTTAVPPIVANGHPGTSSTTDRLPPPAPSPLRRHYLATLTWAFTLFNSVRVLTYLPTIAAIVASGDSSQHSLWTWFSWAGANLTMAAWLYEHNGQRLNRAVSVNVGNALMCLATTGVILWQRF